MVDERGKHPQVRLGGIARAGRNQLQVVGIGGFAWVLELSEHFDVFARLGVPIHSENRLQRNHDGACELHHVVNPGAVFALIRALNEIERADETTVAIDYDQLAVIAQIRAAEAEFMQLDG